VSDSPKNTASAFNEKNLERIGAGYETADVLGVPVALILQNEIIHFIQRCIEENKKGWITGINGHALNLAYKSVWLRDFYHHAILNCSEGMGVVTAAFLSGVKIPKRKVWADWAYELLHMIEQNDYSLFFLGSTDEVGIKAIEQLHILYPQLRISGRLNGYSDMEHNDTVIETINRAKPDIVFVGLGMPKQEVWISRNIDKLEVKIFFPVGALLDYLSGMKKRCPRWMASMGFEWFYRVLTEPQKVWRRYLLGNPLLIWRSLVYFTTRARQRV
jgi:N-acetylglucosaminyldiphosphoundecaprenol N-acetyl-beta-D-mannosaminyltransferase